jgi:hypothetical protein
MSRPLPAGTAALPPTQPLNPAQGSALHRLALSRARLHAALLPPPEAPEAADSTSPGRLLRQLWRQVRRAGRNSPAVDLALGALQAWWFTRSWRPAVEQARLSLDTTVLPLVRRHPWAAVAVAATAGAVLVRLRPWRWAATGGGWSLWRAGLVAQVVQQAAQWPWASMLAAVMAGLATAQATQAAGAPEAPEAPPSPQPASEPGRRGSAEVGTEGG